MVQEIIDSKWLIDLRGRAARASQTMEFPSSASEAFRFLNVSAMDFTNGAPQPDTREIPAIWKASEAGESGAVLLGSSGKVWCSPEKENLRGQGILAAVLKGSVEVLPKALLARIEARAFSDKVSALAEADSHGGLLVRIPRGRKVEGALRFGYWCDQAQGHFRNFYVLEAGAEATIVEEFSGDCRLSNRMADIWLEEGARLNFVSLQNLGAGSDHFHRRFFHVGKDAEVKFFALNSGGRKGQDRVDVDLIGSGAEFISKSAARGDGEQHIDFAANVRHVAPHTKSAFEHWAVMAGSARGVFNGLIHVESEAKFTDAFQKAYGLLLSRKAAIHGMPKLIIATDEVACAHGASVSNVDMDQLFYLLSRGIAAEDALRMIVAGFTEAVVGAIPLPAVQERFRAYLEGKGIGAA